MFSIHGLMQVISWWDCTVRFTERMSESPWKSKLRSQCANGSRNHTTSGSEKMRWNRASASTRAYHHLSVTWLPKPFCRPRCVGAAASAKHGIDASRTTWHVCSLAPTSSTLRARAPRFPNHCLRKTSWTSARSMLTVV